MTVRLAVSKASWKTKRLILRLGRIYSIAMSNLLEQSLKLPIPERIKLVEDIWDSIADQQSAADVALTPEQTAELERRIEYHERHPNDTVCWETVRDGALARR